LFKNNAEDGADFCEAYKSQILTGSNGEKSSFNTVSKVLTILLLLIIIVAVSIYSYAYIIDNSQTNEAFPPSSIQIDDDELIVTEEEKVPVPSTPPEVEIEKSVAKTSVIEPVLIKSTSVIEESDIDKIANDVKLAIAQTEKNSRERTVKISTGNIPTVYLEELAELTEEIDKEKK